LHVARQNVGDDYWQASPVKYNKAAKRARGGRALYRHITVGGGGAMKAAGLAGRTLLKKEERG